MGNYRRARTHGGSCFFTVALADRDTTMLVDHINSLHSALRIARNARPFDIDAIVVLPDHLHCIWTLPKGDADFSTRWAHVKAMFCRNVGLILPRRASLLRKRERGIWQRRLWEHAIRNEADLAAHLDYIHYNPVKHGWAGAPREWPYSSFRRFVARGFYSPNWGASDVNVVG